MQWLVGRMPLGKLPQATETCLVSNERSAAQLQPPPTHRQFSYLLTFSSSEQSMNPSFSIRTASSSLGALALSAALGSGIALAQSTPANAAWPEPGRQAFIDGCRAAIMDGFTKEYLQRRPGMALPVDFHQRAAPLVEPFFASCSCMTSHVERKMPLADFLALPVAQQGATVATLMDGACKPNLPAGPAAAAANANP